MNRTLLPLIAVAAIAAIVLAACGDDSTEPSSAEPTPTDTASGEPLDLDGRQFLSTDVVGHELVDGTTVSLTFQDAAVSANAGCNTIFGGYSIVDGELRTETLGQTEMACEPALMDQDQWIVGLLSGRPAVALDGDTLTLTGADGTVLTMLDREVADPDRPIEGTRWIVDGIVAGDAVSSTPIDTETGEPAVASITITDGQAAVEAGCNTGSASVEVTDTTLTFGPLALTRMMCPEPQMQLEAAVTAVLAGEVTYQIEAGRLSLRGAGDETGEVGLELVAAD
jgi:heat shock protein HslJ